MVNLYTNESSSVAIINIVLVGQEALMTLLEFPLLQLGDPRCIRGSMRVLNSA